MKSSTHKIKFIFFFAVVFIFACSLDVKAATPARVAKLAYDIEKVYIDNNDDTLHIQGWAFNVASDVGVAGHTKVEFKLSSDAGDISPVKTYLHSSYSLAPWLCEKAVNEETGKKENYCKEGSLAIGGTGFEVAFDLGSNDIKPGKVYKVMMKYNGLLGGGGDWKEISVAKSAYDATAIDYNKRKKDGMAMRIEGGTGTIKVTERSVKMVDASGNPLPSDTNFSSGTTYTIKGSPIKVDISPGRAGGINLYPVGVNAGGVTTAYVPSVFGQIGGGDRGSWLLIKTSEIADEGSNEVQFNNGIPQLPTPEGCEDPSKVYSFYYFFLGGWVNMPSGWTRNSAGAAGFNDKEVLDELELSEALNYKSFVVPIDKDTIGWFYTDYKKAMSNHEKKYFNDGNNYFFAYDWWCRENGECYDQYSGCKLDSSGNPTSECSPNKATRGELDDASYQNASVKLGTPLEGGTALKIKETQSSDGFKFSIQRYFSGSPYQISNPGSLARPVNTGKNEQYLHPAVFAMSICKGDPEQPNCDDEVDPAVCAGDSGTEVIFHESDELATCTIKKDNHSGFTIVEKEETGEYCEVACKDDLDMKFPTHKQTAAGQYFILDNYTPELKAKRTCVTSKIDSNKFISDKKDKEKDIAKLYNIWRDWVVINGDEDSSNYDGGGSKITVTETESGTCYKHTEVYDPVAKKNVPGPDQETGTYKVYKWEINASRGPNGTRYEGASGEFTKVEGSAGDTCEASTDKSKETYDADITDEMKEAERNYADILAEYGEMVNNYNKCYSWTDNVMNARTNGTEIESVSANTDRESYKFSFRPDLEFDYGYESPLEKDRSILGWDPFVWDESKYEDGELVEKEGFDISNRYWDKNSTTNSKYDQGGVQANGDSAKGLNAENLGLLICQTNTCSETGHLNTGHYFYTSSYVKREEEVKYTYHLPDVYTKIPTGIVTTDDSEMQTKLQLEDDAVPVNINTPAGTYPYKLTLTNIKDELRQSKESNNPDDDWEERFAGSTGNGALNENDSYVCNYDVINDIYIPGSPGILNYFYRIIDTYEINPLNRTLGYNWANSKGDRVREEIKQTAVSNALLEAEDSDKFVFKLTPLLMKEIRNHNARQPLGFANFDMACVPYVDGGGNRYNRGYHCESQFLTCLVQDGEGSGPTGSCYGVFDGSIRPYKAADDDYDIGDLNHNRDNLINKQRDIDCHEGGIEDAC